MTGHGCMKSFYTASSWMVKNSLGIMIFSDQVRQSFIGCFITTSLYEAYMAV